MSISTVCDRFTITLKRYTTSPGASGQAKRTWTTDARTDAGLVASIRADMQSLSSEERGEYGITDDVRAWRMYTASDPQLGAQDNIIWLDNTNLTRICEILRPSTDSAGRGRLWKTIVQEKKSLT